MAKGIKYYSMREAKKAGKIAGRNWEWKPWRPLPSGWPLWESKQPAPPITQKEHSQYEATLISIAHENLERICKKLSEEDEKLTQEYCSAKNDYERLKSKMDDEIEERKEAILSYEKAKTAFFNFSPRWVPIWLYWFIFIAISCGEGVFNFKVFQIFGADTRETIAMAGAVIISIPVFSEILGHYLKKEEKLSMDKLYIGLSVVIVVALLVFLAIFRETFFKASPDIQIPMSPTKLAMILVVFNLTFFIALSFLSYAEARKNPEEYRKAKKAYFENSFNEAVHSRYADGFECVKEMFKDRIQPLKKENERINDIKDLLNKLRFIKFLRGDK